MTRTALVFAAGLVAIASCAPKPYKPYDPETHVWTTPPATGDCHSDGDCFISDRYSSGCCACCPGKPQAYLFSSKTFHELKMQCAVVICDCSPQIQCPVQHPSISEVVAKCREGVFTMELK
jgi:hypothetical protein